MLRDNKLSVNTKKLSIKEIDIIKMFHVECFFPYKTSDEFFINCLTLSQYIVIAAMSKNENILGYAISLFVIDEADIIYLCVNPKYHRCGVATQILAKLIYDIPCLRRLYLEVDMNNAGAIEFYMKNNFKITRVRKRYSEYGDAYEMVKNL
jgi:ribosomal-protein-alanine N-acetyltransferase